MRESIQATYDHRKTGDRFTLKSSICGHQITDRKIEDPFVRHKITLHWWDAIKCLFKDRNREKVKGKDRAENRKTPPRKN